MRRYLLNKSGQLTRFCSFENKFDRTIRETTLRDFAPWRFKHIRRIVYAATMMKKQRSTRANVLGDFYLDPAWIAREKVGEFRSLASGTSDSLRRESAARSPLLFNELVFLLATTTNNDATTTMEEHGQACRLDQHIPSFEKGRQKRAGGRK